MSARNLEINSAIMITQLKVTDLNLIGQFYFFKFLLLSRSQQNINNFTKPFCLQNNASAENLSFALCFSSKVRSKSHSTTFSLWIGHYHHLLARFMSCRLLNELELMFVRLVLKCFLWFSNSRKEIIEEASNGDKSF